MTTGIVDYGGGNIQSVKNALSYLDKEFNIIRYPHEFNEVERIILPGQGAFASTIGNLKDKDLFGKLKEEIIGGKPYFGICIGMQILFDQSEENPGIDGLKLVNGKIKRFTRGKIPQIGWNLVSPEQSEFLTKGYAYFVNSFYTDPKDPDVIAATTDYFGDFVSAIVSDNIFATQFHPEKSGTWGLEILERWIGAN